MMLDPSLGTEDFDLNEFRLHPNPGTGIFMLNSPLDTEYSIVNILGEIVQKGNVVFWENRIDIQNKSNGLYFLQFEKGRVVKFIKQ